MSNIFELPLDAIKDEYLYLILQDTEWDYKTKFNISNPNFTFIIDLNKNKNKNKQNKKKITKIKNILEKQIKLFEDQDSNHLKNLLKKIINKIPETNTIISNLKNINSKLEQYNTTKDQFKNIIKNLNNMNLKLDNSYDDKYDNSDSEYDNLPDLEYYDEIDEILKELD